MRKKEVDRVDGVYRVDGGRRQEVGNKKQEMEVRSSRMFE
jgi:hypothetical protein